MNNYSENLLKNSSWQLVNIEGSPLYYSSTGPFTLDKFTYQGNRTCSITQKEGESYNNYDEYCDIGGSQMLVYGETIRCIDKGEVSLIVYFYDEEKELIEERVVDVSGEISYMFLPIYASYIIPEKAKYAKFSTRLKGEITACTFCAPFVYKN